ncbi:MAG: hypothetical protein WAS51_14445 [Ilumatobacteraceae bacterium]
MSGTAASVLVSAGGVALPAPVVRAGATPAVYDSNDKFPQMGATVQVTVQNPATVSAHGLPAEVMANLDKYRPKLELLRYVPKRTTSTTWSRTMRNAGYVHPSHGPGASGDGSHTHGGMHTGLPAATMAIRPTEWDVLAWGQVIDVTQGMTGFLNLRDVTYRQPSTGSEAYSQVTCPCPSGRSGYSNPGRRFPYGRVFRPGYYEFRWSIIDPTDDRGQRLTGPTSATVSITSDVFPFIPDEAWLDTINGDYHATATVDARYDPRLLRVWVGSVSRLPR